MDMHFYNNVMTKPRVDLARLSNQKPTVPARWGVEELTKLLPEADCGEREVKSLIATAQQWEECAQLQESIFAQEMKAKSEVVSLQTIFVKASVDGYE